MNGDIDTTTQKSNTLVVGLIVLIALIIIIGLGGLIYLKSNTATKPVITSSNPVTAPNNTPTTSANPTTTPNNTPTTSANTPTPPNNIAPSVVCARFIDLNEALRYINIACVLDLNGTSKGVVSDDIAKLTNLNTLNLPNNSLTQFPTAVFQLQKLLMIDLSNNQITTIPKAIASSNIAKTLQILILTGNPISSSDQQAIKKLLPKTSVVF